jgi:hypothetical protein
MDPNSYFVVLLGDILPLFSILGVVHSNARKRDGHTDTDTRVDTQERPSHREWQALTPRRNLSLTKPTSPFAFVPHKPQALALAQALALVNNENGFLGVI